MSESSTPQSLNQETAAEYLRQSPLGAALDDEELATLAERVRARQLVPGEYLIEAGTKDDSLHILVDGKMEVLAPSIAHEPLTLHVLGPGDLAGEMSFVDGEAHAVGLRALNNCQVISIERQTCESLLESHPQLVYKFMRAIIRAAHHIVRRMNLQYVEMTRYFYKTSGRY